MHKVETKRCVCEKRCGHVIQGAGIKAVTINSCNGVLKQTKGCTASGHVSQSKVIVGFVGCKAIAGSQSKVIVQR